jgi:hypothetical protein
MPPDGVLLALATNSIRSSTGTAMVPSAAGRASAPPSRTLPSSESQSISQTTINSRHARRHAAAMVTHRTARLIRRSKGGSMSSTACKPSTPRMVGVPPILASVSSVW